MNLQVKKQSGFTIVELLIVIVVIGILAAITIVAYNGIQNRSNTTAAQSVANSVDKKIEAWNASEGVYPSYCELATNSIGATGTATGTGTAGCTASATAGPAEAKLDNPNSIGVSAPASTGATRVQVVPQGTSPNFTGALIHYRDYTNNRATSATTTPASFRAGS